MLYLNAAVRIMANAEDLERFLNTACVVSNDRIGSVCTSDVPTVESTETKVLTEVRLLVNGNDSNLELSRAEVDNFTQDATDTVTSIIRDANVTLVSFTVEAPELAVVVRHYRNQIYDQMSAIGEHLETLRAIRLKVRNTPGAQELYNQMRVATDDTIGDGELYEFEVKLGKALDASDY